MRIGLGVCARDEGSTIVATLTSIVQSASFAAESCDWQLIVCANGCTDGTVQAVTEWIEVQADTRISLCELEDANLVEAQRVIAARLTQQGADILGFFDGDILVAPDCIPRLMEAAADKSVRAVYATSIPLSSGSETLVQRMLNQYDRDTGVFSRRKHLHGRAFLVKEWNIPRVSPPLLADDIFLSCDFLLRYGECSIKLCPEAIVYFHQVSTITDFYRSYKRRRIELEKCLQLNPRFGLLPPDQLNRRVVWRNIAVEPPQAIALWLAFFALRLYFHVRFLAETSMPWSSTVWSPTTSTKKPLPIPNTDGGP